MRRARPVRMDVTETGLSRAWMRVRGCDCGFFRKDGSKADAHFKGEAALAVVFLHLSRQVYAARRFCRRVGGGDVSADGRAGTHRSPLQSSRNFGNDVVADGTAGTYHSALREKMFRTTRSFSHTVSTGNAVHCDTSATDENTVCPSRESASREARRE